ncbi:HAD family hydrolase [Streptomyces sp. NPDC001388]|uniref:HAD family hydrolase n=1 Tax=unclassified Streptomyces TaxID=2593676 RepID=UPI0036CC54EC
MLRLAATDLDGTLLRSDLTVAPRTLAALRAARRRGVRHLIVTGRPAADCAPVFAALDYEGIAVCGQGAQLYDVSARRMLCTASLERDLARALVAKVREELAAQEVRGALHLAVNTSGPDAEFVRTPGFTVGGALSTVRTCSPAELWNRPVDRVFLRHDGLADDALAELVAKVCEPGAGVTHSDRGVVEILPPGTDKGTGLARAAALLGIDLADVVAFGDMPNDIPLLGRAGHGVAMANGHWSLKVVADELAPHHDDDGVARVLERLTGLGAAGDGAAVPVQPSERNSACVSTC